MFENGQKVMVRPDLYLFDQAEYPTIHRNMLSMSGETYTIETSYMNYDYRKDKHIRLYILKGNTAWVWLEKWLKPADPDLL